MDILVILDVSLPDERNRAVYQRCMALLASGRATLLIRKGRTVPKELATDPNTRFARHDGRIGLFRDALSMLNEGDYRAVYTWHRPFFVFLPLLRVLAKKKISICMESQHSPYYYLDAANFKGPHIKIAARTLFVLAKIVYPMMDLHVVMAHHSRSGLAKLLTNEFRVENSKILALPNGVDLGIIRDIISEVLPAPKESFIIGYVGTIGPGKGYELVTLADRIRELIPDAKILMAGPLRGVTEKEMSSPGVEFFGRLSHGEAVRLMHKSDVTVYIGTSEIFENRIAHPGKILEYMALGKPVIAPNYEGIAGFFTEKTARFLYDPSDIDKVVDLIYELYGSPGMRDDISQEVKQSVSKYDWRELNNHFLNEFMERIDSVEKNRN